MAEPRILLIIPCGGVGGMERLALNLYRHYLALGYTVKVVKLVALAGDIVNFDQDEIALADRELAQMSLLRRCLFYLGVPLRLAGIVRRHRITHSIGFGDMANLFSSLGPSREFKVASIHSLKSMEMAASNVLNKLFRLAYRTSYRRFQRTVCISRAIGRDLLENCGFAFPDRLELIYNPHDVQHIQALSSEPLDAGEDAMFAGQTVMFIGRMCVQKSPWHLVNAFRMLSERGISARLLFIGDGDPEVTRYTRELIDAHGLGDRVAFLGRRANPYKYLVRADVLALSSHYEGTPNVIVEAIALGVPVVSSNCTDGIAELMSLTPDVVGNGAAEVDAGIITPSLYDGVLGLPVSTDTSPAETALADALAAVLGDSSYRERVRMARGQLLEKFDLARTAQAYLAPVGSATR
jgi:glycosyltransferase involved in cell wall biosynthesis